MSKLIMAMALLFTVLMMQGCKKIWNMSRRIFLKAVNWKSHS